MINNFLDFLKNKMEIKSNKKIVYLEIMRIIAIFFVIFNHTGTNGFLLFTKEPIGSIKFFIYLIISIFCKMSVPLFFMISGALLLKKENESIKILWKKRILKMIMTLIVFSFIYYLNKISFDFSKLEVKTFISGTYTGTIRECLWFIYAYIAYLVSLPFLRSMIKKLENKEYYYMIVIAIIFDAIIPICESLFFEGKYKINSNLKITWLISTIVLYPCIGYFLENKFEKFKNKKIIFTLWGFNLIGFAISCYMTYRRVNALGEITEQNSQVYLSNFVIINCISIYITLKYLFDKIKFPEVVNKITCSIGTCTFGIYLLHGLVKENVYMVEWLKILKNTGMNSMLVVLIWNLCIMIIGYFITFILIKIPGIKKIVGG